MRICQQTSWEEGKRVWEWGGSRQAWKEGGLMTQQLLFWRKAWDLAKVSSGILYSLLLPLLNPDGRPLTSGNGTIDAPTLLLSSWAPSPFSSVGYDVSSQLVSSRDLWRVRVNLLDWSTRLEVMDCKVECEEKVSSSKGVGADSLGS